MSAGICVCEKCYREVHQGKRTETGGIYWFHCDDKTPLCPDANAVYPKDTDQIVGNWCGEDAWGVPETKAEVDAALKRWGLDPEKIRAETKPMIAGLNRKARRALKKNRK